MKKLLLTLALTLFASSAMSADFIKVHEVYYDDPITEMTINVDSIYKIRKKTDPKANSTIYFTVGTNYNRLDNMYVTESKAEIEAWLNMKN